MSEKQSPSLANPQDRARATLFQQLLGPTAGTVVVSYIAEDFDRKDVEYIYMHGYDLFKRGTMSDRTVDLLLANAGVPEEYRAELLAQNEATLNAFGTMADHIRTPANSFTLYDISQSDIPAPLAAAVESAWMCLSDRILLPGIAEELNDPTVVVEALELVERGPMRTMDHPRHAELFLKLLHKRAESNAMLKHWLMMMGQKK